MSIKIKDTTIIHMQSNTKKVIVGGNWKCNGTLESIKDLVNNVLNKAEFDQSEVEVVIAPIDLHISTVKGLLKNDSIKLAS